MAVRAMSRATGGAVRANPRHTQPREGHRSPAADGRAPLGPAPGAMGGLARLQLGGLEGHDAHGPAKPGGPGDGRHHRVSGSVARPPAKVRVAHRQPPGRAMAVRAMSRATGGAARANPRHTQPREGHRRPAADGRAPLGPAPGAMGVSGSVARPPAKVRVAHRQPHGRAMAVRAMSRATGGAARANPRHTRPRGTPAPHRGRRGTVEARPLCKGGLARNHHTVVGGDRGTTRTARQNRAADGRAAPPLARPRCPVTGLGPGGPRAATQTRHGRARHVPSY
ncbi:hypothetical protein IHE45_20G012800 [Dioscorea alata]|uniref:Uncharacterized protein n=1 Tax=Dioscorea alata TaxID=55571 RepID=A0ACB7TUM1_DIOAL|nr:hypothetical protein IHE45_20G012800 [Dioscorea alata]